MEILKDAKTNEVLDKYLSEEERTLWANLKDRNWRLSHLYYIKDKHGKKVLFKPNWAQKTLLNNLWFFSIVLKARQLGITTLFCILYLDQVLFSQYKTAGIIAHKQEDAKRFFEDKVKFAWDNLPEALQGVLGPPNTDSVGELSFPNGSKIFVSTTMRGGTLNFLHISEFGKICASYPMKAEEIVTGSINAVEQGNFVTIESTAEGRSGRFFDFCEEAKRAAKEGKTLSPLEFKFFFFPWWEEPTYRMKGDFSISREFSDYFGNLKEKHGIDLDPEQRRWYVAKKRVNGENMFREYPSIPEEAFLASIEGAYYSTQMAKVYEDKRIRNVPYDARLPVDTFWDLGMNDTNVILFCQGVGNEIRFIDMYTNSGEGLAHYTQVLKEKGYTYGKHVFPHDVEVRSLDEEGKSRRQSLIDLGVTNIRTIEKTPDVNDDIEGVRKLFSRFYFDETKCEKLIDACNNYKKEWDDKLGEFKNRPRHDKSSHIVDPLRLLSKSWTNHMIDNSSGSAEKVESFF